MRAADVTAPVRNLAASRQRQDIKGNGKIGHGSMVGLTRTLSGHRRSPMDWPILENGPSWNGGQQRNNPTAGGRYYLHVRSNKAGQIKRNPCDGSTTWLLEEIWPGTSAPGGVSSCQ